MTESVSLEYPLVSQIGRRDCLTEISEFLITDLALASHGIPSFTLTSPNLLAPVLDAHPPTAVIIDAGFLAQALELILDAAEASHHVLIVLGDLDAKTAGRVADHVRLVRWSDIEEEGRQQEGGAQLPSAPSTSFGLSTSSL